MPTELKHCSGQCAEIVLVEYAGGACYEVEAYRLDGAFIVCATTDARLAEEAYRYASQIL